MILHNQHGVFCLSRGIAHTQEQLCAALRIFVWYFRENWYCNIAYTFLSVAGGNRMAVLLDMCAKLRTFLDGAID